MDKKILIMTEKPSVARDFAKVLKARNIRYGENSSYYESNRYVIVYCFGHMIRLKNPGEYKKEWEKWDEILLKPEKFEKLIIDDKKEQTELIIEKIMDENIEAIINAGDAGREGEGIQREIYELGFKKLGKNKPVYRFWTSEVLGEKTINEKLENLINGEEFDGLYKSYLARERADWIVGINATRVFTKIYGYGKTISIGRVQTPVLSLIVKRENEIRNFKSENYWNVLATSFLSDEDKKNKKEPELKAKAVAPENKKGDRFAFWNKKDSEELVETCKGNPYIVVEVEEKEKKDYPPRLFSMPTLQQYCNKYYGWTPDLTLKIAQSLYEKKYQTYPRTDSEYLGDSEKSDEKILIRANATSKFIKNGKEMIEEFLSVNDTGKRIFNEKKLTDHHAIIPSDLSEVSTKFENLTDDEKKMFKTVVHRFIQVFLPPAITAETTANLENSGYKFIARGKVTKELGWKKFRENVNNDKLLKVKKGEELKLFEEIVEFETSPPKRFTPGEIINAMTNAHKYINKDDYSKEIVEALKNADGIGTGATRDKFIPILETRDYIEIKKNIIYPKDRGMDLINLLGEHRVTDFAYTALLEDKLSKLTTNNNEEEFNNFIENAYKYAEELIERAQKNRGKMRIAGEVIKNSNPDRKTLGDCPQCGGDIIEGNKAYGCSNWKNGCKFTIWPNSLEKLGHKTLTSGEIKKLLKGESMLKFKNRDGIIIERAVKIEPYGDKWHCHVNFDDGVKRESVGICPKCGKNVIETGKFFCCEEKREICDFIIWKNSLEKLGGGTITKTLIKKLLKDGKQSFKFKSKNGRNYFRDIEIKEENGRYFIKVDFDGEIRFEGIAICPECGGDILDNPENFGCSNWKNGCKFTIWKNSLEKLNGKKIGLTEFKKLLKEPVLHEFKDKNNIVYERYISIVKENDRYLVKVDFSGERINKKIGECPLCGSDVYENSKTFGCSKWRDGCKFALWKDYTEKIGSKKMSKTIAAKLLEKKEVVIKLKDNNGNNFEGILSIDEKGAISCLKK